MTSDSELIVLFVTIERMSNYREHSNHMKTATILRYPHPFLVGMS